MKKADAAVEALISEIKDRDILEIACGRAEFSSAASDYAHSVSCIDLEDCRVSSARRDNIHFEIMDAAKMSYSDKTFDTIFLYNALFHVRSQWEAIKEECRRVLKPEGSIYIVGTWKLDTALMKDMFGEKAELNGGFLIYKMLKKREA